MSNWDILKQAEEHRLTADKLHWEGTFKDYLDIITKNPRVSDLAHARMFDMIVAGGVEDPGEGQPKTYTFFEGELFGMERTIQHLVEGILCPGSASPRHSQADFDAGRPGRRRQVYIVHASQKGPGKILAH